MIGLELRFGVESSAPTLKPASGFSTLFLGSRLLGAQYVDRNADGAQATSKKTRATKSGIVTYVKVFPFLGGFDVQLSVAKTRRTEDLTWDPIGVC